MKSICIVGSGIAGSLLALELAESSKFQIKVIDIDNINKQFDSELKLQIKIEEKSFENIRETVGYGFGGTSNLWHGVLADLDDEDYEKINENFENKDEISEALLNDRLEKYYGSVHYLYNKKLNLQTNLLSKHIKFDDFIPKSYIVKIFPPRFRKILIKKLRKHHDNIHLISDSVAIKLKLIDRSVASIECVRNGRNEHIYADIFILCTGALETPRILMQSLCGTEYFNELIGKGLMDHPVVFLGQINLRRRILYQYNGITSFFSQQGRRIGLRIPKEMRTAENLNHSIFIRPNLDGQSKIFRDNVKLIIHGSWRSTSFKKLFKKEVFYTALTLLFEKLGIGYYTKNFIVSAQLEQPNYQGGCISLSNEYDRFGRRIPLIANYASEKLIFEANHLSNIIERTIKEKGVYEKYHLDRSMFISGSHHSGTCRMGNDPNHSVVDQNLKYHYLTNLYICDNSIFPKVGNANISYPLSRYAIKLANFLSKNSDKLRI